MACFVFGLALILSLAPAVGHGRAATPPSAAPPAAPAPAVVDQSAVREQMQLLRARSQAALGEIARLRSQIRAGETVVEFQTQLTRLRAEQVVSQRDAGGSSASAWSESFEGFFQLFSFSYAASGSRSSTWRSSSVDTRVLEVNPQEVASFSARERADFMATQERLSQYVLSRASEIARLKVLAAGAFRDLAEMRRLSEASNGAIELPRFSIEHVNGLLSAATEIRFFGRQSVLRCQSTSHPAYATSSSSSQQSSWSESGSRRTPFASFIFSASGSQSSSTWENHRRFAFTETTCSPTTETRFEAGTSGIATIDLGHLDSDLRAWARWAGAIAIVEAPRIPDPRFGNPYFERDAGALPFNR